MQARRWRWVVVLMGCVGMAGLASVWSGGSAKRHAFAGRCLECHTTFPRPDTPYEDITLTESVDRLCARCHQLSAQMSHPVGVAPKAPMPLQRYLDPQGRLTCITCHDVHKEEREGIAAESARGLLRGHASGKAFCATCHRQEALGAPWRHQAGLSFAHATGRLQQGFGGTPLDAYSVECLSCHDGNLSALGRITIVEGVFRHGITGPDHPVGVLYPSGSQGAEYVEAGQLPKDVPLFDGRIGCLSCHSPFSTRPAMLVLDMTGSALCLACHRK